MVLHLLKLHAAIATPLLLNHPVPPGRGASVYGFPGTSCQVAVADYGAPERPSILQDKLMRSQRRPCGVGLRSASPSGTQTLFLCRLFNSLPGYQQVYPPSTTRLLPVK